MSPKEEKGNFKEFVNQNGYMFVFSLVCGFGLLSYILCSSYLQEIFRSRDAYVLNTSSVKGVWVSDVGIKCPNIKNLEVDMCVEDSYFEDFNSREVLEIALDQKGRILFTNEEIFLSGFFDIKDFLNKDVWADIYLGDLNIKINEKQWVFKNIVWDKTSQDSLVSILETDTSYLLVISPSVSMVNRTKQFWIYEYNKKSETLSSRDFFNGATKRRFIESGEVSFALVEDEIYLLFERFDPALLGNSEIELYKWEGDLQYYKKVLLLDRY